MERRKVYTTKYLAVSLFILPVILLLLIAPFARGEIYKEPITGIELVLVNGGCYIIGDNFDKGRDDEKPTQEVCVDDFFIGKYEVTQAQWRRIIEKNPSFFQSEEGYRCCPLNIGICPWKFFLECDVFAASKEEIYPVENVSWNDIQEFLEKLNKRTGKEYRLPTEAEWEYAARSGGKKEKWAGTHFELDLDQYAWFRDTSGYKTQPVGQMKPNGLGLCDMTGNVWEWVNDWYDPEYYKNIKKDNPQGPPMGNWRIMRGGSWFEDPWVLRSSYRGSGFPFLRSTNVGFRLAMTAP